MDDVLIHVCDKVSSMDVQKCPEIVQKFKRHRNSNAAEIQMPLWHWCYYGIDAIMALRLLWHWCFVWIYSGGNIQTLVGTSVTDSQPIGCSIYFIQQPNWCYAILALMLQMHLKFRFYYGIDAIMASDGWLWHLTAAPTNDEYYHQNIYSDIASRPLWHWQIKWKTFSKLP